MAKILKIDYSLENLKKILNKRISRLDYEGALCVLNSMRNNNALNCEIIEYYAKIYFQIEDYELAINYWNEYLKICKEKD